MPDKQRTIVGWYNGRALFHVRFRRPACDMAISDGRGEVGIPLRDTPRVDMEVLNPLGRLIALTYPATGFKDVVPHADD